MTGGLLQLVAMGLDDVYLVNQPEITFFKIIYRRHSNFSTYDMILEPKGNGKELFFDVERDGDFLHQLYLIIDLPDIIVDCDRATNITIQNLLKRIEVTWTYAGSDTALVTQTVYDTEIVPLVDARMAMEVVNSTEFINMYTIATEAYPEIVGLNDKEQITFRIFTRIFEGLSDSEKIKKILYNGLKALYEDYKVIFVPPAYADNTTLTYSMNDFIDYATGYYIYKIVLKNEPYIVGIPPFPDINTTISVIDENIIFYHIIQNSNYQISMIELGNTIESYIDKVIENGYGKLKITLVYPYPSGYIQLDAYKIYQTFIAGLTEDTRYVTSQAQLYATVQLLLETIQWNIDNANCSAILMADTLIDSMFYDETGTSSMVNTEYAFRLVFYKPFTKSYMTYRNDIDDFYKVNGNTATEIDDYFYTTLNNIVSLHGETKPTNCTSYIQSQFSTYFNTFVDVCGDIMADDSYKDYMNDFDLWDRVTLENDVFVGRLSNIVINSGMNFYDLFPEGMENVAYMNFIPYMTIRDIPFLINQYLIDASSVYHYPDAYIESMNLIDNDERTDGTVLSDDDAMLKYYLYTKCANNTFIKKYYVVTITHDIVTKIRDIDVMEEIRNIATEKNGEKYVLLTLLRPEGLLPYQSKIDTSVIPHVIIDEANPLYPDLNYLSIAWICNSFINRYTEITEAYTFSIDPIIDHATKVYIETFVISAVIEMFRYFSYSSYTPTEYINASDSEDLPLYALSTIWFEIQRKFVQSFNTLNNTQLLNSTTYNNLGVTSEYMRDYLEIALTTYYSTWYYTPIDEFPDFTDGWGTIVPVLHDTTGYDYYRDGVISFTNADTAIFYCVYSTLMPLYYTVLTNLGYCLTLFQVDEKGIMYTVTGTKINRQDYFYLKYLDLNTTLYEHEKYHYIDHPDVVPSPAAIAEMTIVITFLRDLVIASPENMGVLDAYDNTNLTYLAAILKSIKEYLKEAYTAAIGPGTNPYVAPFTNLHTWFDTYSGDLTEIRDAYLYFVSICSVMSSGYLFSSKNISYLYNKFIEYVDVIFLISNNIIMNTNMRVLLPAISDVPSEELASVRSILLEEKQVYVQLVILIQYTIAIMNNLITIGSTAQSFCYVNELGCRFIKYARFFIDEQKIDEYTDELLHIDHMISKDMNHERGYNIRIGNTVEMTTLSSSQRSIKRLYVKLPFWFCRNAGNALPLLNMMFAKLQLKIEFNDYTDLVLTDPALVTNHVYFKKIPKFRYHILAQYIYVDQEERNRLAQLKLEYLIERNMINSEMAITRDLLYGNYTYDDYLEHPELFTTNNTFKYKISLDDPTKFILWNIKFYSTDSTDPLTIYYEKKNWNVYGCHVVASPIDIDIDPVFSQIQLKFNGRDREIENDEIYYTYAHPLSRFMSSFDKGNYCYSFALFPLLLQPSGTCNFSQLEDNKIFMTLNQDVITELLHNRCYGVVKLYARSYNILRVMSGKAGLAFYG